MVVNLRFGHHYAYSMLPHVATLLVAIGETGPCTFSDERIVDGDIFIASEWSLVSLELGYPVLLDLPLSPAAREQLAGKLLVTHRGHSIDFRLLVYELLVRSLERDDPRTVLSLRPDLCARLLLRQASSAQARGRRSQSPVALPPGDGPSVPSGQAARALGGVSGSLQADVSRGAAARTHGRRARSVRRAMSEFPAALACADQHAQRAQPGAG